MEWTDYLHTLIAHRDEKERMSLMVRAFVRCPCNKNTNDAPLITGALRSIQIL